MVPLGLSDFRALKASRGGLGLAGRSRASMSYPDDRAERDRRDDSFQGHAGDSDDGCRRGPLAHGRRPQGSRASAPLPYDALRIVARRGGVKVNGG
jgi:hypothetical protein